MVTHCHEKICASQLFFRGSNICWTHAALIGVHSWNVTLNDFGSAHTTNGSFRVCFPCLMPRYRWESFSTDHLRTLRIHFWARIYHVHVYSCLRKAYRPTSHGQGTGCNRRALCTNQCKNNSAYFSHVPAQKSVQIVLRDYERRKINDYWFDLN